jgi:hypothetical protein
MIESVESCTIATTKTASVTPYLTSGRRGTPFDVEAAALHKWWYEQRKGKVR